MLARSPPLDTPCFRQNSASLFSLLGSCLRRGLTPLHYRDRSNYRLRKPSVSVTRGTPLTTDIRDVVAEGSDTYAAGCERASWRAFDQAAGVTSLTWRLVMRGRRLSTSRR
jgi:hypothetical protein